MPGALQGRCLSISSLGAVPKVKMVAATLHEHGEGDTTPTRAGDTGGTLPTEQVPAVGHQVLFACLRYPFSLLLLSFGESRDFVGAALGTERGLGVPQPLRIISWAQQSSAKHCPLCSQCSCTPPPKTVIILSDGIQINQTE